MYMECTSCGELKKVPEEIEKYLDRNDMEATKFECANCKRTDDVAAA